MSDNIGKAITTDAGGARQPAQGLASGFFEPDGARPPKVVEVPDTGIVVSPPAMAAAMLDGARKKLALARKADIPPGRYSLVSLKRVVGVVDVGEMQVVDKESDFLAMADEHLVTSEVKAEWAEAQPSWELGPWYVWPVAPVEMLGYPLEIEVKPDPSETVFHVQLKSRVEKVKDAESYDAGEMTDAQLRDDFRIVLAWRADWEKDPKGFKWPLATIRRLLREIVAELVKRGPEAIQFNPAGMKPGARAFFQEVVGRSVPKEMLKALRLTPETDTDDLSKGELERAHWELHGLYGDKAKGWSTEDVVNLHAKVVDALLERYKEKHPPPPDNGLDELSGDFEDNAGDQPDWHTEPAAKALAKEYATINRSGVVRGRTVKAAELLQHFKTFKMRTPYISLVGGLANHGETPGDFDVLVNDEEELPAWMRDVIEFRLGRCLPEELSKRLHVHFDRERGPFTNFVPLFDLHAERVNDGNDVVQMRDKEAPAEPLPNMVTTVEELAAFAGRRASA